jgi:hypothetical protein
VVGPDGAVLFATGAGGGGGGGIGVFFPQDDAITIRPITNVRPTFLLLGIRNE